MSGGVNDGGLTVVGMVNWLCRAAAPSMSRPAHWGWYVFIQVGTVHLLLWPVVTGNYMVA